MTSILDLPPELLERIISYAPKNVVLSTRLAHRALEYATFSGFAKRFFRKKGYLITRESLNTLESISKHPQLQKYVEHVWFNPDCWTFQYEDDRTPRSRPQHLQRQQRQPRNYAVYREVWEQHVELLYSFNSFSESLLEIFRNLPNLKVIGMRRSVDHYAWGCNRLKRLTGLGDPRVLGPIPSKPLNSLSGPTYLFRAITHALGSLEDSRIERLYTDAIELDNLSPNDMTQKILTNGNSKITQLELNVCLAKIGNLEASGAILRPRPELDFRHTPNLEHLGENVVKVLSSMPRLDSLSLSFLTSGWGGMYNRPVLDRIVIAKAVNALVRLKLDRLANLEPRILMSFLKTSSATLVNIKLRNVELQQSGGGQVSPWRPVLALLRHQLPRLDYVYLFWLRIINYDREECGYVAFQEPRPTTSTTAEAGEEAVEASATQYTSAESHLFMLECRGRAEVVRKLEHFIEGHGYEERLTGEVNDDDRWDTDTSDDEEGDGEE